MTEDIEPRRVEQYVKIAYWGCNVLGHKHQTKRSAASCILKRKGEAGELKKLKRNLSMLQSIADGKSFVTISLEHHCSDSNVIKAVNSSINKAWKFANTSGGVPYKLRTWRRSDLTDQELKQELNFFIEILREYEVKLEKLLSP